MNMQRENVLNIDFLGPDVLSTLIEYDFHFLGWGGRWMMRSVSDLKIRAIGEISHAVLHCLRVV